MPGKVLVTGYEPFGGSPINPSGRAARALDGELVAGRQVIGRVLPVAYQDAIELMASLIEEIQPDVVVMSGQSGRPDIAIEKVAVNVSGPGRDNAGHDPHEEPVVAGGPAAYFSTLPITATLAALHDANIPASISYTAGTYLCNHIFYGTLHHLRDSGIPAGFFHVPSLPEQRLSQRAASMSQDMITDALRIAVQTALAAPGLPLHRFREPAELLLRERAEAELTGDSVGGYPELSHCSELQFILGRTSGEEAVRLQLLDDFSRDHSRASQKLRALEQWEQGDSDAALATLSPCPRALFVEGGGPELLPFAERLLAQMDDPGADFCLEDDWDHLLPADRLCDTVASVMGELGLAHAAIHRNEDGAEPGAVFTDRAWLQLAPGAGWRGYYQNFLALGRALHLAFIPAGLPWEYRRLGDAATLCASGLLLAGLLCDPAWLQQHLDRPQSEDQLQQFSAWRRRQWYRAATLVKAYQQAQMVAIKVEDGQQRTRAVAEGIIEATGGTLNFQQATKAVLDMKDNLAGFRALLFENGIRTYLVQNYGRDWWGQPRAGEFLRQLWGQGLRAEGWWQEATERI